MAEELFEGVIRTRSWPILDTFTCLSSISLISTSAWTSIKDVLGDFEKSNLRTANSHHWQWQESPLRPVR